MDKLTQLITKIPTEHKRVLVYLLNFLKRVSTHAEVSLMTVQNLALVFGPNILRPRDGSPESAGIVAATPIICKLTELLITETDRLFGISEAAEPARTRARQAVVPIIELPKETKETAFSSGFIPGKSPRRVQSIRIGQTSARQPEINDDSSLLRRASGSKSQASLGNSGEEKNFIKRAVSVKFDQAINTGEFPLSVTLGAERERKSRAEITIESLLDRLAEEISAREELERRIAVLENLLQS